MSDFENEPEYIPESNDIKVLKLLVKEDGIGNYRETHINTAFDLLKQILFRRFHTTDFSTLVRRSANVDEAVAFCATAREAAKDAGWTRKTLTSTFSIVKHILRKTSVSPSFIDRLSLVEPRIKPKNDPCHYLPKLYKLMADDNPAKQLVLKWAKAIKQNTKNKSPNSLKMLMYFIIHQCLPPLNLDPECWHLDVSKITSETLNQLHEQKQKKLGWVKIFVQYVLNLNPDDYDLRITVNEDGEEQTFHIRNDNTDLHRISADELELIYQEACKSTRDELLYLLLTTTGMRVGGLVGIKIEHVASVKGVDVTVKDTGRTIEKGNKWFSFCLNERVRHLIHEWISQKRPASDSPYLFPGRAGCTGHMTTGGLRGIFHSLCKKAGLSGKHLHPHAIRHSFAHILLETGNSPDIVSKLMGHSNTSTTEHYYLKENAAEVASRANIPWLKQNEERKKIVPSFMAEQPSEKKKNVVAARAKKKRMTKLFSKFENDMEKSHI